MADWGNVQQGLVSGFQIGQKTGGRFSGLGTAISQVAEALKTQQAQQQETAQKQNLLGYTGLTEGKIVKATQGEDGAFEVPGMGWMKKAPSDITVYDSSTKDSNGNPILKPVGTVPAKAKILGQGMGAAGIAFAKESAPAILDSLKNNDVSGYENANSNTRTAVAKLAGEQGMKLDDSVLGYKADKSVMTNVKLPDQKVNQASQLMTLLDSNYDKKTDTYNIPPTLHTELSLGLAKLLSPTGVVPLQLEQSLRQGTLRENLSNIGIYAGFDPKDLGGPTQSVIKMFRDSIQRQGQQAQQQRDSYLQGNVNNFNSGYKPIRAVQSPDNSAVMSTETSGKVGKTKSGLTYTMSQ